MRKLLLLCALPCFAATDVYVAQASAGSNNGTSCGNAYAYTFFNTAGNWGGGYGVLSEPTPKCSYNFPPCGGGYDFPLKYGKSFGIADGAANTQMGLGILNIASVPSVGSIFNVSMKGIGWK